MEINPKFFNLDIREQHDILSALRGPDLQTEEAHKLKKKFTSPIRCWFYQTEPKDMAGFFTIGDDVPENWNHLYEECQFIELDTDDYDKLEAMYHYTQHLKSALNTIIVSEEIYT